MKKITYKQIVDNKEINDYIAHADDSLEALGYTNHSFLHVSRCSEVSRLILETLGYPKRTIELAQIASYMHDIGNVVNRKGHAQSGALMAFNILTRLNMDSNEIALIVSTIGNHDEHSGAPVNEIAAALIIADKTDVRRERVRQVSDIEIDIHDRVNYAAKRSDVIVDKENKTITLDLELDTSITQIKEYFDIFLERMEMTQLAAKKLDLTFKLKINNQELI